MQGRKAGRREARQEGGRLPFGLASLNSCLPAVLLFCLAAVFTSGCTRAKAKTVPDAPLDVPAPPTRDIETNETEPPPPATLVQEPARNAPPRPRPATPRDQPRAEPPRPEPPKPAEVPPAVEPPKTIEEPARPAPLQTMPPAAEVEAERSIRAALVRANSDLGRVDYRLLNKDARTQYDTAKRFVNQADEALRTKNLVFAKNLADKAATLAAQLAGR